MTGRRSRLRLPAFLLCLVIAGPQFFGVSVLVGEPAGAQASAVQPGVSSVVAPTDYFSTMWGDPMDFSNAEDFDTTPRHMATTGSASLGNGRLNISGAQQVFLLRSDPGSYPTSATRDPRSRPLDAGKFKRVTFRMYSDRETNGAIFWRQCNSCAEGLKYFHLVPGWHSYDLDMTGPWDFDGLVGSSLPPVRGAAWAGNIELLWMITNFEQGNDPNLALDDFAVIEPTGDIPLNLNQGSGVTDLWMDLDGNTANDNSPGPAAESASRIGSVAATGLVGVPSGVMRRGQTARFYTFRNNAWSAVSNPVSMPTTSSPAPRVLSPWEGAGDDWANVARWDPWDFDQWTDTSRVVNANTQTAWGALNGSTAGPTVNDPGVYLNTNGKLIDGQTFHKIAITINYDGPWGLEDAPGGGMNGRIMWHPWGASQNSWQVSDDIVLKTGRATYIVDLQPWPPTSILDPAGNRDPIGWGVGRSTWIDQIRFDPHEDRGHRTWQIEDVKLMRNDYVEPGHPIDIKFIDDAWAPGTTADIIADPNRDPNNAGYVVLAQGISVGAGINTFQWGGWPAQSGSYYIRVVLHRGGRSADAYSSGQIDHTRGFAAWPPERANGKPVK